MNRQVEVEFSKVKRSDDWCYDYGAHLIDVVVKIKDDSGDHTLIAGYLEKRLGYGNSMYDYLVCMGQTDITDYIGEYAWDELIGNEDSYLDVGDTAGRARTEAKRLLLKLFDDADKLNAQRARETQPDEVDYCCKCDGYIVHCTD